MEIGLLSNQDIIASLPETCMQYQSCLLDPFFRSIVKAPSHPLQLVLQDPMARTPTFKRSQNNARLEKKSYHMSQCNSYSCTHPSTHTQLCTQLPVQHPHDLHHNTFPFSAQTWTLH